MFFTRLKFSQILDRFYNHKILDGSHQERYDFLLLFVSSFDGNDINIISKVVDNAKRIDRITGKRICFFYFIDRDCSENELNEIEWIARYGRTATLFDMGAQTTVETADDICRHFGLLRSQLPAFLLINQKREVELFSIQDYQDFERFLSPLNIIHSYNEDKELILSRYESIKRNIISEYNEKRKKTVVTQRDVDSRKRERDFWKEEIKRLNGRLEIELSRGEQKRVKKRKNDIDSLNNNLKEYPELVICGEDESIPYPQEELNNVRYPQKELDDLKAKAAERLDHFLNIHNGINLIEKSQEIHGYPDVILNIWNLIRMQKVSISRILEKIRYEIHEHGFDVFISCKSKDYVLAHELYDYLVYNGFKPFLADTSIKEVGIDQYTALIGEVINVCQNMIVFATNLDYIETPYVAAEWHTFVNDINTGHKPNAKLVNILSPNINVHNLPAWLRDKQCFTTENYKDGLLNFLKGWGDSRIHQLRDKIQNAYNYYIDKGNQLHSMYMYHKQESWFDDYIYHVKRDKERINYMLDENKNTYNSRDFDFLQMEIDTILKRWEDEYNKLLNAIKELQEDEETKWHEAIQMDSEEAIKIFLEQFPDGIYARDARNRLNYYLSSAPQEDAIVLENDSCSGEFDVVASDIDSDGAIEEAIDFDCLPNEIQDDLCDEDVYVCDDTDTFEPNVHQTKSEDESFFSMWKRLFKRRESLYDVFSSIFASAEVRRKSHMLVQIYLHLYEETERVKALARESDEDAERRDYIPLQCKLKKGDKVDVLLNIYGETLLMSDKKSVVWQGSFTKCSFDYFVPKDIDVDELSCMALLMVNEIPVGEMRFITRIVETPRKLNPEIIAHKYNKVFISYSHQDESKVKFLHEGLAMGGVPHFFDRSYLKPGDIFPKVIQDYINSADLFVLCWSENAAQSEYVKKERMQALERAYPKVQDGKLSIYPMSIEPRAELPSDMKENYHFGEI